MLLYVVTTLLGSAQIDLAWSWCALLTLVACAPLLVAVAFTLWAATRPSSRRAGTAVMLHFAYGSNMHRARDAAACAGRAAARCRRACRIIASSSPRTAMPRSSRRGQAVHGVLWRITPRDRVTLDAWENVAGGLYRAAICRCTPTAGRRRRWSMSPGRVRAAGRSRLYGACDRGGRGRGNCPRLYCGAWSAGCRPAARRRAPQARRF